MTRRLPDNLLPDNLSQHTLLNPEWHEIIRVAAAIHVNFHNLAPVEIEALCSYESKKPWAREWRAILALEKVRKHYLEEAEIDI